MARATGGVSLKGTKLTLDKRIGDAVVSIRYQHADDGELYQHDFETTVEMWSTRDGSIAIISPDGISLITER